MTKFYYGNNVSRYPVTEPPKTMKALLIFLWPSNNKMLETAIVIVRQSVMVSLPMEKHTETMMATDATFTASKKVENDLEFRIFLTKGFSKATNTNEGRKIPIVEMIAPDQPLIW